MSSEADFLAKLQAEPADDATRLVYADWLEERGDPSAILKAEFLPHRPKRRAREEEGQAESLAERAAAVARLHWTPTGWPW